MTDSLLTRLEYEYPEIAWREPAPVQVGGKDGVSQTGIRWACRVCISQDGLLARDVELLPVDRDITLAHIRREHA